MRAAVISGPGVVSVERLDDPTPSPSEVVIEVAAVGLCGTDLHILAGHHGRLPVVPGHEVTGTVVAVGAAVDGLAVGTPVAVDPSLPCGRCRWCRDGRTNLCPDLGALGVTVAGGAADLMAAPAASCVALGPATDVAAAALIEPLSCAVHAFDLLRTRLGSSVVIYGAGTMGLLLLSLAERAGAGSVDLVEPSDDRRAVAATLGASRTAAAADALDDGAGWDVVVDASGHPAAIADGLTRVASGGTYVQFGVADPSLTLPISPYDVYRRELTIVGSMAVLDSFERAARLFEAGTIDARRLITSTRALADVEDALAAFAAGQGLKTQLRPGLVA